MASPENRHCASYIGALSFPITSYFDFFGFVVQLNCCGLVVRELVELL